jgi:hypothetical protein
MIQRVPCMSAVLWLRLTDFADMDEKRRRAIENRRRFKSGSDGHAVRNLQIGWEALQYRGIMRVLYVD